MMDSKLRKNLIICSTAITVIFLCLLSCPEAIASEISYYIYNAPQRNVVSLTNNSGTVINEYEYDTFGNVMGTEDLSNGFSYAGEQYDKETGLIFLRSRYYDSSLGRFITKDSFPGVKSLSQSLNSYIYVRNNPVNNIDPTGEFDPLTWSILLSAGITGVDMATYSAAEAYYNWKYDLDLWASDVYGEKATWGLISLGTSAINLSKVIGEISYYTTETFSQFTAMSTTLQAWSDYLIGTAMQATWDWVSDIFFLAIDDSAVSDDPMLIDTLDPLNWDPAYAYLGDFGLIDLGNNIYIASDFGGVSLSTTANLMLNIDDIAGATYDEATGQVIFFGKEDAVLPAMDLDDLAVAINSVYKKEEDPGVSIGTEASDQAGYMKVRYDGATAETEFGEAMFESDRQLKILSLGKDNETGQSVSSGVSGYKNMLDRYREDQYFPQGEFSDRMWFKPKEIVLSKSADDNDMVYDSVVMELLTESKFEGNVSDNPVAEAFADHFTAHYNEFAAERPILKELERLGKIVGVVKWIKDNEIPFDLSFVENYIPEYFNTDEYTPAITVETSWTEGDSIYTLDMTGGVAYTQPNEYLDDSQSGGAADATSQAVLNLMPADTNFMWNLSAQDASVRPLPALLPVNIFMGRI